MFNFLRKENIFLYLHSMAKMFSPSTMFLKIFLPIKTWKNRPQKLPNWPKSSTNLNSCSIKISHCATSLKWLCLSAFKITEFDEYCLFYIRQSPNICHNLRKKYTKLSSVLWLSHRFFRNSYFILQICHAKSFKMRYIRSLYLSFSLGYS